MLKTLNIYLKSRNYYLAGSREHTIVIAGHERAQKPPWFTNSWLRSIADATEQVLDLAAVELF